MVHYGIYPFIFSGVQIVSLFVFVLGGDAEGQHATVYLRHHYTGGQCATADGGIRVQPFLVGLNQREGHE